MPYPGDDLDIEERLKGKLEKARAEYQVASGKSDSLIKVIPSGIHSRDGELHIRQTGRASRAALQKHSRSDNAHVMRA